MTDITPAFYGIAEYGHSQYGMPQHGDVSSSITHPGGAFAVSTELFLSDRSGRKIERIPIDLPVSGRIDFNEDARPARRFSLAVNDPLRLEPFVDYLIPEVVLTDAAGNRQVGAFGHFLVTPPSTRLDTASFTGTLEGKEATWILDNDELGDVTIPAGTDSGAAAREIALAVMDARQIQLPDTGLPLLEDFSPSPGESRFQVISDLYTASSWHTPGMNGNGVLVTSPYVDIATAPAARSWSSSAGQVTILPPVEETPDWGRLKNRVIVRNLRPDQPPVFGRAWVQDPTSPLHPDRLGGGGRPLWLSLTVDDSQVETKEDAEEKAGLLLSYAASWYRRLSVLTVLDLQAGAHETIDLDVVHQGAQYDGKWLRRAWSVELRGLTALQTAELTRAERWRP